MLQSQPALLLIFGAQPFLLSFRLVGFFDCAKKRARSFLLRVFKDLRGSALFVNLPLIKEAHAIGELPGEAHLVCDHQHR